MVAWQGRAGWGRVWGHLLIGSPVPDYHSAVTAPHSEGGSPTTRSVTPAGATSSAVCPQELPAAPRRVAHTPEQQSGPPFISHVPPG